MTGGASGVGWVAGVDGCRAGWVVALRHRGTGEVRLRVVAAFAAVLALPEAPAAIAVDMPIGLEGEARPGGRACDRLARALLGARRASLFPAPARAALLAFRAGRGHAAVSRANRAGRRGAPGLSRQTFHLLPRIDALDRALLARGAGATVVEAHPELSFAAARGRPMRHAKKTAPGRRERERLLARLGFARPLSRLGPRRPPGVAVDDVLDACIVCWTAGRVADGTAVVVPAAPPAVAAGLALGLWR